MSKKQIIEVVAGGTLVEGKVYPTPLPPELGEWYCYLTDSGHSIIVLLEDSAGAALLSHDTVNHLVAAPVKAVLRGYRQARGYIVCDLPYSPELGLMTAPEDDEY